MNNHCQNWKVVSVARVITPVKVLGKASSLVIRDQQRQDGGCRALRHPSALVGRDRKQDPPPAPSGKVGRKEE